jgi:hypothetical protein
MAKKKKQEVVKEVESLGEDLLSAEEVEEVKELPKIKEVKKGTRLVGHNPATKEPVYR